MKKEGTWFVSTSRITREIVWRTLLLYTIPYHLSTILILRLSYLRGMRHFPLYIYSNNAYIECNFIHHFHLHFKWTFMKDENFETVCFFMQKCLTHSYFYRFLYFICQRQQQTSYSVLLEADIAWINSKILKIYFAKLVNLNRVTIRGVLYCVIQWK